MEKRALLPGERDGERLIQLVRPGELVKTASAMLPEVQDFIGRLVPDARYTYVLVNAMSFSEFFGSNSNADYYGYNPYLDFNGLLHAPADFGRDLETDRENGKTWPYGFPTYYNATAFAHHKNTDPVALGFGVVVFVAPNHRMKRIELVVRIDNAECLKKGHGHFLQRIRAGERVDVSMGCKVPFDLCSICTDWDAVKRAWKTFDPARHAHPGIAILESHRKVAKINGLSVVRADYCEHMRTMRSAVLPDGRKVWVFNDFPRFFDISVVWVGADRTARVMWHLGGTRDVADEETVPQTAAVQKTAGVEMLKTAAHVIHAPKTAAEIKRSEIEKEIPDGYAGLIQQTADEEPAIPPDLLRHISEVYGPRTLLSTLASLGIALRPEEFMSASAGGNPVRGAVASSMSASGTTLDTGTPKVSSAFAVRGCDVDPSLASLLQPFMEARSSFAPYLYDRMHATTLSKTASKRRVERVMCGGDFDKFAAEYLGYRISILERAPEVFSKFEIPQSRLSIEKIATATDGAALLLGLGPMIHLLSSHLRQNKDSGEELNAVGNFIAENPSFTTAASIGAGLRAAMEIEAAGGVAAAVKNALSAIRGIL